MHHEAPVSVDFGDIRENEVLSLGYDTTLDGLVIGALPAGSHLTPAAMQRLVVKVRRLGRMLTDEEVRLVVEAEDRDDANH